MEPQLFSRGNLSCHFVHRTSTPYASMEPQLFSRGNRQTFGTEGSGPFELQWSRSFSAAEMLGRRNLTEAKRQASMEPQLFSRGNFFGILPVHITKQLLQWSRSFSAAEISAPTACRF